MVCRVGSELSGMAHLRRDGGRQRQTPTLGGRGIRERGPRWPPLEDEKGDLRVDERAGTKSQPTRAGAEAGAPEARPRRAQAGRQ